MIEITSEILAGDISVAKDARKRAKPKPVREPVAVVSTKPFLSEMC